MSEGPDITESELFRDGPIGEPIIDEAVPAGTSLHTANESPPTDKHECPNAEMSEVKRLVSPNDEKSFVYQITYFVNNNEKNAYFSKMNIGTSIGLETPDDVDAEKYRLNNISFVPVIIWIHTGQKYNRKNNNFVIAFVTCIIMNGNVHSIVHPSGPFYSVSLNNENTEFNGEMGKNEVFERMKIFETSDLIASIHEFNFVYPEKSNNEFGKYFPLTNQTTTLSTAINRLIEDGDPDTGIQEAAPGQATDKKPTKGVTGSVGGIFRTEGSNQVPYFITNRVSQNFWPTKQVSLLKLLWGTLSLYHSFGEETIERQNVLKNFNKNKTWLAEAAFYRHAFMFKTMTSISEGLLYKCRDEDVFHCYHSPLFSNGENFPYVATLNKKDDQEIIHEIHNFSGMERKLYAGKNKKEYSKINDSSIRDDLKFLNISLFFSNLLSPDSFRYEYGKHLENAFFYNIHEQSGTEKLEKMKKIEDELNSKYAQYVLFYICKCCYDVPPKKEN